MKKTVYVVEDDEDIGELIAFLLTDQGYEVSVFNNIATFTETADPSIPALLIIDIMLPDGNGLDICRDWKSNPETGHVPILLMSAYDDNRHDERAKHADGFISKPFDIKILMAEVQAQLG